MFDPRRLFHSPGPRLTASAWHALLADQALCAEPAYVEALLACLPPALQDEKSLVHRTGELVLSLRATSASSPLGHLLRAFPLETAEGRTLLSLAECLLRLPDADSRDRLLREKLACHPWHTPPGTGPLVRAACQGLRLARAWLNASEPPARWWQHLSRPGLPLLRQGIGLGLAQLSRQFVLARNLETAGPAMHAQRRQGLTHSLDMLGEAALTQTDADRYLAAYLQALELLGHARTPAGPPPPSLSIKLSALHPRLEAAQQARLQRELLPRLEQLLSRARQLDVPLTLDAEEQSRLEPTLSLFAALYGHAANRGWGRLGLVVQAYGKRALPQLAWLAALSEEQGDTLPVRLVKGAYWDAEIKWAQQAGLADYPVFTRKATTDLSYLVCAGFLLGERAGRLRPQFATHNVQSAAAILQLAEPARLEFQRLQGMGESLYRLLQGRHPGLVCRVYAPVGEHRELLPYLVRRLLENGSNSSFVHQLEDAALPLARLCATPQARLVRQPALPLPLPGAIFAPRRNSAGVALYLATERAALASALARLADSHWQAGPLIGGRNLDGEPARPVCEPQARHRQVGMVSAATPAQVAQAAELAQSAFPGWEQRPAGERAALLDAWADGLEAQRPALLSLCIREAGKTWQDGLDEIREAVDLCRYYAAEARRLLAAEQPLPGVTGEQNRLRLRGRGLFVCISPWNFPLAIFCGQIAAALVGGNVVLAKPAEQGSLLAQQAVSLAHQAGIPEDVLHCLPGPGAQLGPRLLRLPMLAGVCFTGSTATAKWLQRALAERPGALLPLIAETGGVNAMLVDESALPEQLVRDLLSSAFRSAGQRCSALRLLCLPRRTAPRIVALLAGAMQELRLGDPGDWATDIGPLIDMRAQARLQAYLASQSSALLAQAPLPAHCADGCFVAPSLLAIAAPEALTEEHFGPLLHLYRYAPEEREGLAARLEASGYGLTLGLQTRSEHQAAAWSRARVGNVYLNRDQIGAVVGAQPFGGLGLSGTGPKAGGPHYLLRFTWEQTLSSNSSVTVGNPELLAQVEPTWAPEHSAGSTDA